MVIELDDPRAECYITNLGEICPGYGPFIELMREKDGTLKLKHTVDYKAFEGPVVKQMPLLIKEGRVPISTKDLLKKRLEVLHSSGVDNFLRFSWWIHDFITGDALFYHPKGKLKIDFNSSLARSLTPRSKLYKGAFVLTDEVYDSLEGPEFTNKEYDKLLRKLGTWAIYGKYDKLGRCLEDPILRVLVGDDFVLREYDKAVWGITREMDMHGGYKRYIKGEIGPNLGSSSLGYETPTMRLTYVEGLVPGPCSFNDFNLLFSGVLELDNPKCRLVGAK